MVIQSARPKPSDSGEILSELAKIAMDAIVTPAYWANVLDCIIEISPACAAIVTLRDSNTCQIVNDHDLEQHYHSPLIRGFSLEAVGYYLTELRTIDPWAKAQIHSYPHRPMLMSDVCPPEQLPDNPFFAWLNGLGMQDTVAFELARMPGYWTACNLFLPSRDQKAATELVRFAEAHFAFLRSAWGASQALSHSQQTGRALMERFGESGRPCALVDANGGLLESNEAFESLLQKNSVKLSGPTRRVVFAESMKIYGLDAWESTQLARFEGATDAGHVHALAIAPDPRFEGKRENQWLLEFGWIKDTSTNYDLRSLTQQEAKLFHAVASGLSIVEGGTSIGIKRTRTYEIWDSVKEKLGIDSAHQIR